MKLTMRVSGWAFLSLFILICGVGLDSFADELAPQTASIAPSSKTEHSDGMYHYSIWGASVNRAFDGFLPVDTLRFTNSEATNAHGR